MLEEMGTEVVSAEDGRLVAGADETSPHNDVMQTVKTWGGEIFVVFVHFESVQRREVVGRPVPAVAEDVVEAFVVGGEGGHL